MQGLKALGLQKIGAICDGISLLGIMQLSGVPLAYGTQLKGQGFLVGSRLQP